MRLLDTDVDLTLLTVAVLAMAWAVLPAPQTNAQSDVTLVCHQTACYPAALVWPDERANR